MSAPALLEFMKRFSFNGRADPGPGSWASAGKGLICHMIWRGDGIHIVALFNGHGNVTREQVTGALHRGVDMLKEAAERP